MNIASGQMLQDALQNLGTTFQRSRQLDAENAYRQQLVEEAKQRTATDKALREAQLQYAINRGKSEDDRAAAQEERLAGANQPRIQADLKSDDGQTMTFTGTPDQLDNLIAGAKQQGKNITVENKKNFAAQFNVNGAQFSFTDEGAANTFADGMKAKGIDVYAPQQAKIPATAAMKKITEEQDAVPDDPGRPAVTHWFKPNEPAVPPTKGHGKITTSYEVPLNPGAAPLTAADVNSQVQGATNAPPATNPAPTGAPAAPTGQPDPRDIEAIQTRATPGLVAAFERKYGAGSSSQFLKPQQPIPGGGGLPISTPAGMPSQSGATSNW